MELLQLIYFSDAAKTENFSKTAKKYTVPPSNISQSIHRLEKELNCTLFNRTANKITLNEQGKKFYLRIQKALDLLDEAKEVIHENEFSGEIKICILTNRRTVTRVIERFKEEHPHISFIINHSLPGENDNYDLIISDDTFKKHNFEKNLLMTENIVLAISENNPLARKKTISAEDLKNQKFITMPDNTSLFKYTNLICNSLGFVPHIAIKSDDPFYLRKYVELELGIAFIPEFSWQGQFSEKITFKPIGNFKRNTYVFRSNEKHMSYSAKVFLKELINEFKI